MGFSHFARTRSKFQFISCGRGFASLFIKMSFTNVGKVLPVLMSEADKCGRGFTRARFCHLVYEMSFINVGEVLPACL